MAFSWTLIRGTKMLTGDDRSTPEENDLVQVIRGVHRAEGHEPPRILTNSHAQLDDVKKLMPPPLDETVTWSVHGIEGYGEKPSLIGTCKGPVIIVGCGRTVWDDLSTFSHRWPIMALNDIGLYLPIVHHWVSLHDDILICFHETRCRLKRPEAHSLHSAYGTHTRRLEMEAASNRILWPVQRTARADLNYAELNLWHLKPYCSISGVFAVFVALLLGYEHIVLAGIPADSSGGFYDPPGRFGPHGNNRYLRRWAETLDLYPIVKERVRSLSGNTREWLGAPEAAWIESAYGHA